jgi:hypothetical protein
MGTSDQVAEEANGSEEADVPAKGNSPGLDRRYFGRSAMRKCMAVLYSCYIYFFHVTFGCFGEFFVLPCGLLSGWSPVVCSTSSYSCSTFTSMPDCDSVVLLF